MPVATQDDINALLQECQTLEGQLKNKKAELKTAIISKLTEDGKQHPLESFLGKSAIYDRPRKWDDPRTYSFTEDNIKRYGYLWFNGIVSGKEINTIYHDPRYNDEDLFYSFIIPDEDSEVEKGEMVPIDDVYELLLFKIL